ncbi:MAG: hypothetical protein J5595_03455 [Bacteroidales bacterium]|nr:hypothetical protein [Bacteroidales bacterium]
MDEYYNQGMDDHLRIQQDLEQQRINREFNSDTKPSKYGWVVVLIFALIMLIVFYCLV